MSAQYKGNIESNKIVLEVITLSLSSSGHLLLVGQYLAKQLHIFNASSRSSVTTFDMPDKNNALSDAVWLPYNESYIMCVTTRKVLYLMPAVSAAMGSVTSSTNETSLKHFGASQDNAIYATDYKGCVIQSRDGATWSEAVKEKLAGESCWHAVRVSTCNHSDNMWVIISTHNKWILRVYTMSNNSRGEYLTWRNVDVPNHVRLANSKLAYDGQGNIFTTDTYMKTVHVWFENGQYNRQLLSSGHLIHSPSSLVIDTKRHVLYVGQMFGIIAVFTLQY